jgi:hypothetical protein
MYMTINITKNFFVEISTEWTQIIGHWNWYSFTIINVYFENDVMTGGYEAVFTLLGFTLRFRYNTKEFYRKMDEWLRE